MNQDVVEANRERDLWLASSFNRIIFVPKGWCDDYSYAKGHHGGLDWTQNNGMFAKGPEILCYAPNTVNEKIKPVARLFILVEKLQKLEEVDKETARTRDPDLFEFLEEDNFKFRQSKPKFKHDCDKCKFLGHFLDHDVYICNEMRTSIIARFGDDPEENASTELKVLKQQITDPDHYVVVSNFELPFQEYLFSDYSFRYEKAWVSALAANSSVEECLDLLRN